MRSGAVCFCNEYCCCLGAAATRVEHRVSPKNASDDDKAHNDQRQDEALGGGGGLFEVLQPLQHSCVCLHVDLSTALELGH